ncbi:hypothetical protein [Ralstonia pseudosolanacearum]|uniref:hypothetical protein n=1 Tax=Ralstonia pseudosolanacearum TaxID=1310165 RepID=UPI0030D4593F
MRSGNSGFSEIQGAVVISIVDWVVGTLGKLFIRKPSWHRGRVDALFELIAAVAPATSADKEWLAKMHKLACQRRQGWRLQVDAYLAGLATGGAASREAIALVRARLEDYRDSGIGTVDVFAPLFWISIISATVVSGLKLTRHLKYPWDLILMHSSGLLLLIFVGALVWARGRRFLNREQNPALGWTGRAAGILFSSAYLFLSVCFIAWLVGNGVKESSVEAFRADRGRFLADPQGFPMLQEFAKSYYGVDVVLGDVDESWASTSANLPGSSIASMMLVSGYCRMSMYRGHLAENFPPAPDVDMVSWAHGVMMHEFAHCLDEYRDLPGEAGKPAGTLSLAPTDAKGVSTIATYLKATEAHSTVLWREALADVFAVGYWRLAMVPGEAAKMIASLRAIRVSHAGEDAVHGTACWIDRAAKAPMPASYQELLRWADALRSSATCSLAVS